MQQSHKFSTFITFVLIAYAFSFPLSKAATNLFEITALILWVLEGNWQRKIKLYKNNLLSISIILLIGISFLSMLWHGFHETTLHYIAKYRHLLLIFVFYSSFNKEYAKTLLSAFIAGMFISELTSYGIFFQLIHLQGITPQDPSPFMSHMTYSTVLAFTASILLLKYFYEKQRGFKIFYALFFLTATANLFINGGRTGQIIFLILIFILFLSLFRNKIKATLASLILIATTVTLAYNFSPNFHHRIHLLYEDFSNMIQKGDFEGSGARRVALTFIGAQTLKDNFVKGTGVNYDMKDFLKYQSRYNLIFNYDYKHHQPNEVISGDYHNAFLTITVQLGVLGVIIIMMLLYALIKLPFSIPNQPNRMIATLFVVSFILFSFTHNTLHTMNPMIFFTLFAGFFNALTRENTS